MGKIQHSLNFYQVKVFLYKYTPEFRLINNAKNAVKKQMSGDGLTDLDSNPASDYDKVGETTQKKDSSSPQTSVQDEEIRFNVTDRYTIDLNEEKFFRKFDISEYVSNYTFSQSLDDNTFGWNLMLYNPLIPTSKLNSKDFKVEGKAIDATALQQLALYESQAKKLSDKSFIEEAKRQRGIEVDQYQIKTDNTLDKTVGLRLSDLIQPFDVISVFLYKGNVPLTELRGTPSKDATGRDIFTVTNNTAKTKSITDIFKGEKLNKADLQKESILLSPDPNNSKETLFSNEFNGFVMGKATSESAGNVNVLNLSGAGITRLFGSTRRIIKSSIMQKSLYSIGETPTPDAYTVFENIYVGKRLQDIFLDLFNIVYRIKAKYIKQIVVKEVIVDGRTKIYNKVDVPGSSFYDLSAIEVGNHFQTNLFSIPPFLLGLVMKRLGYNYREPIDSFNKKTLISEVVKANNPKKRESAFSFASSGNTVVDGNKVEEVGSDKNINQNLIDDTIDRIGPLHNTIVSTRKPPLYFSPELNQLRAYFKFIENVLRDFAPAMKTPFEIFDEIQEKTFLEFFERPDGTTFIRPPEYNDTKNVIFSSTLHVVSSNYTESVENILSRQNVGWALDILKTPSIAQHFAFVDGKLLMQYGLLESSADPNPNVTYKKVEDEEITKKRQVGLFRYAEYLLRLSNASLKQGSVTCDYDKRLVVGRTYFDEKNKKFAYITGISKNINTGANVSVTLTLSYVRDAYLADFKRVIEKIPTKSGEVEIFKQTNRTEPLDGSFLQFEPLVRLVDLAGSFSLTSVDKTKSAPEPE